MNNSLVSITDYNKEDILSILAAARFEKSRTEHLKGKVVATLFYEPSTRNKIQFERQL